uniref:Uncharacterized protein n=1 Tax=viral metagenome TaxID=1070528 RepID=A0A6C0BW65_9ZZZZ
MSKSIMATLGNLAIFLIVLLLILHITGYVEVRAKTTEGFYYEEITRGGKVALIVLGSVIVACIIFGTINQRGLWR